MTRPAWAQTSETVHRHRLDHKRGPALIRHRAVIGLVALGDHVDGELRLEQMIDGDTVEAAVSVVVVGEISPDRVAELLGVVTGLGCSGCHQDDDARTAGGEHDDQEDDVTDDPTMTPLDPARLDPRAPLRLLVELHDGGTVERSTDGEVIVRHSAETWEFLETVRRHIDTEGLTAP